MAVAEDAINPQEIVYENCFEDGEGDIVEPRRGDKGPVYRYTKAFLETVIKSFPTITTTGCYFYIDDKFKVHCASDTTNANIMNYGSNVRDVPVLDLEESSVSGLSDLDVNEQK
jgi:hypothetical protein